MKKIVLLIGFGVASLASFSQEAKLMLPIGHTDEVKTAFFSPDGRTILTSGDNTAKIWDAATGILLLDLIGHTFAVNSANFNSDGTKVVTASNDGSAKIWNVLTGKVLANLDGSAGTVNSALFSPDGKLVVTALQNGTAEIWNATTGALLLTLKGNAGAVFCASFSPDGKKVVTRTGIDAAKIWDTITGTLLESLDGHIGEVSGAPSRPDEKKVVTAYDDTIGTPKIWVEMKDAQFSPDGRRVVTAEDSTAKIWDAATGILLKQLKGHTDRVDNARFSPDGKKVITASNYGNTKIWNAATGALLIDLKGSIISDPFSPDGKKVIMNTNDTVKILDSSTGALLTNLTGDTSVVNSAEFSPDGKRVVTACSNHTAKVWDATTGKLLVNLSGHSYNVNSASFSPNGEKVITASSDGTAKIWDIAVGKLKISLIGHTSQVTSANFNSDGTKMVTASSDGTAKIWEGNTGKLLVNLDRAGAIGGKNYAAFGPDAKKMITSDGSIIKIWGVSLDTLRLDLKWQANYENVFQFNPDGSKIVIAVDNNTAKILDAGSGAQFAELKGHKQLLVNAQFSPDGKKVATASWDKTVKIWDADSGALLTNISCQTTVGLDMQFSPDGKELCTTLDDSTAQIWDVATGVPRARLTGNTDQVYSVQFSPDGTKVVTALADYKVKIWNAATGVCEKKIEVGKNTFVDDIDFKNNKMISTRNCELKLFNLTTGQYLYSIYSIDSTDYLVTDAYGRYDGTEAARKLLYFTCGTEVIGLDQVKDQLWVPNLAERIMKGDSINAKKLSDLDICGLIPEVEKEDKSGYHFIITPQRGGLGETVVYVNGIEEKRYKPSQLTKTTTGYELNLDEKELQPYFIAGQQNPVTVKAYTAKNDISSRGAEIMQDETKKKGVAPNLYAAMIGVSDYKGPELQLKYAAKDAEDISAAISASAKKLLDTAGGKEHVFMYNLTTGKNHYELPEKIAIKNLFGEIGRKATANDILLIFFAGHGVTSGEKRQFYFLTADASQSSATDAPDQVGISTKELSEWMQPSNIKAQKRILILDACNSGQSINELVKVGADGQNYLAARNDDKAEQIKAIDKLNEKSGLFILAASASNQSAYEMGRYSQGLLTYSLLKAIKQQPDILEDNKYLNVSRWFTAAEKTVSDMVRETGNRQEPQIVSAGNFNIGVVDQDVMAGIKLADEKPLFTASNFQNSDETIADDDLGLNNLLDNKLNEISSRGENNDISYIARTASPDAYLLSGRYEVKGEAVTIRVNIKQNKAVKYKFELSGKKSDLALLAEQVVDKATDWILKNK